MTIMVTFGRSLGISGSVISRLSLPLPYMSCICAEVCGGSDQVILQHFLSFHKALMYDDILLFVSQKTPKCCNFINLFVLIEAHLGLGCLETLSSFVIVSLSLSLSYL